MRRRFLGPILIVMGLPLFGLPYMGLTVLPLGGIVAQAAEPVPPAKPGQDAPPADAQGAELSVAEIAKRTRDSIVIVRHGGRGQADAGLGTGFVIDAAGLIATNLHVIGEGRPITVETAAGKSFEVTEIVASDRIRDLAIVRIPAPELKALELGDSSQLVDGQPVVAMGNPQGLERSVVSGVVSGRREIDGRGMIQLAIPIEPGNSGGPLLDMQGRVHGLLTMKSLVTPNLGFAVAVNDLKNLLAQPNPVTMERWLTIGALDPQEWKVVFGGRWRQRAGRIQAEGMGSGFGGRTLCLWQEAPPERPFEIAVSVKLQDESGAAGLAFASDGGDKHYGFYPTNGKLRFTRFEGFDVNSWTILHDEASKHYKSKDWNDLKLRVEADRVICYLNDHVVYESRDDRLTGGQVGLAKFRQTVAEFRGFRVAKDIPSTRPTPEVTERIGGLVADLPAGPPRETLAQEIASTGAAGTTALRTLADRLEEQAKTLRLLAAQAHRQTVLQEFTELLARPEAEWNLIDAGLLIARLDNEEVDVAAYRREFDRLANQAKTGLAEDATEAARLEHLNRFLFRELGFHGSRADYYNRSNSYLNEVLDDREGIPITLSVVYIELAAQLGLRVVGLGLPGHFVVRFEPQAGDPQVIDVFEGGTVLTADEVTARVRESVGRDPLPNELTAMPRALIVKRMLHNLLGIASRKEDRETILPYLDLLLTVDPESHQERWFRAIVRYQTARYDGARDDARLLTAKKPAGIDLEAAAELIRRIDNEQP